MTELLTTAIARRGILGEVSSSSPHSARLRTLLVKKLPRTIYNRARKRASVFPCPVAHPPIHPAGTGCIRPGVCSTWVRLGL